MREKERSSIETPAIGQRERIAFDRPAREDCVADLAALVHAGGGEGHVEPHGVGQRDERVVTAVGTHHLLETDDVGVQLGDDEGRPRGIAGAATVEARPAVHVVGRDGDVAPAGLSRRRDAGRAQQTEVRRREMV
jgi:hypothetical protein